MIERKLWRGDQLQLKCRHVFPLKMSPGGGVPVAEVLDAEAGTRIIVAQDCEPHIFQIPFHFAEEQPEKYRHGLPFLTPRGCLNEVVVSPG